MRSRKIPVQRTTNRMRSSLTALVLAAMMQQTVAQTAFTRAAPCPADDIVGYSTINALNSDMEDELSRIVDDGGAIPTDDYIMTLCPGSISAQSGALRPILDRVVFMCTDGTECAIDGSTQRQVLIQDSAEAGYTITSITFMGVTFSGFNGGVSSSVQATAPTVVRYVNSDWRNFNSLSLIIVEQDATVQIANGEIGTIAGLADDARAQTFFINFGGVFVVDRLSIRTSMAMGSVFQNSGELLINGAKLEGVATPSVVTSTAGSVLIENMIVEGITSLTEMFSVSNIGSTMDINRLTMRESTGTAWNGIRASSGAEVTLTNSEIEDNTNLRFGVIAQVTQAGEPMVKLEAVTFARNTARETEAVKALVASIGVSDNIERGAFADVLRVDFIGNTDFTSSIFALFGGETRFRQSCFEGNTNQVFSVFVGKAGLVAGGPGFEGPGFVAQDNFVDDNTERSDNCNQAGVDERVFQEAVNGGCFVGDCSGSCVAGADDSDSCLSDIVNTNTPSDVPSPAPPTTSPSAAPSPQPTTGTPSSGPSNAPSTSSPSTPPSLTPSLSRVPTGSPSATPSVSPSLRPTVSVGPSESPSVTPSLGPSGSPTSSPSTTPSSAPSTLAPSTSTRPTVSVTLSPTGDIVMAPTLSPTGDIVTAPPTPECPPFNGRGKGKGKGKGRGYHGSGAYYDRNGCQIAPPQTKKSKKSKKDSSSSSSSGKKNSKKLSASSSSSGKKNSKKLSASSSSSGKKVSGKKKKVKSSKSGKKSNKAITKLRSPSVPRLSLGNLKLNNRWNGKIDLSRGRGRGGGRRDLLLEDEEDEFLIEDEELEEELEEIEEEEEWEDDEDDRRYHR